MIITPVILLNLLRININVKSKRFFIKKELQHHEVMLQFTLEMVLE